MIEFIKNAISKIDLIKTSVAITALSLMGFICYALVYIPIPDGNKDVLNIIIGIISNTVSLIAGYYYGSSQGSQKKTELINKMTDQK